ncbi:MAG: DNA-directed RNA polymerase subunit omega [Clostridium sp.]|uniref:DNA-directed RNA polymerase subunit omega n=1 Tax=Clostridium sp. TaxID=1506 RepID=UPI003F330365
MSNSMINPSVDDLLKKVEERYTLVTLTSKRARQIIAGSTPLSDVKSNKPLTIAINEVNEDAFEFELPEEK